MRTDEHQDSLTFSGDYITSMRDFALARGVEAQTLLQNTGLGLEDLLKPPTRVPYTAMHHMVNNLATTLLPAEHMAVEFGHFMATASHGFLGIAIQGCHSLRDVIQLAVQFIKTRTEVRSAELLPGDEYLTVRVLHDQKYQPGVMPMVDTFFEFSIMGNVDFIMTELLKRHRLSGKVMVHVTSKEPQQIEDPVTFNLCIPRYRKPEMQVCIPNSWLDLPLQGGNAELSRIAAERCESELQDLSPKDLLDEIRERIRSANGIKPSLEKMAGELYMSASTLQRRLKQQGKTYQQLKAEVRQQEACDLLRNSNLSVEDIAAQLGFCDGSNFSKSFKSWTGLTPNAYKQQDRD